jgi:predicted nucleic acid-binding Zn ribbon protein
MVPEDEGQFGEYCSAECAGFFKAKKKNKRKRTLLFVGLYAVAIIVFVVLAIIGQN